MDIEHENLNIEGAWKELSDKVPVVLSHDLWAEIYEQYNAPHRMYHSAQHVLDIFKEYGNFKSAWTNPIEVTLAILFHDFVYEPAHQDNQLLSAKVARTVSATIDYDVNRDYVARLIKLSADRHRMVPKLTAKDVTFEEALFLDCDQWILGADFDKYAAYVSDLEQECAALGTAKFKLNRKLWLNKMLSFDHIFLSEAFKDRERAARENLQTEMNRRTMKLKDGKLAPSDDSI